MQIADTVQFIFALGIGGFLSGYNPGFWWSIISAAISSFFLTIITTYIGTLLAAIRLRSVGMPSENIKFFLRPTYSFSEKFFGTITTILITEGIMILIH